MEPIESITITLRPDSLARESLRELVLAFDDACRKVHKMAKKHNCRHQAALHVLAYRLICPVKLESPGIPSQYAIRAIGRVSHQLRQAARQLPDPYPAWNQASDPDGSFCHGEGLPEPELAHPRGAPPGSLERCAETYLVDGPRPSITNNSHSQP